MPLLDDDLRQRMHREAAEHLDTLAAAESDPEKARFWRETAIHVRQEGGLLWTTRECAEHCGITPGTYRDYEAKLGAPGSLSRARGRTGENLYDSAAVRQWHASRTGQGSRTDLRRLPNQ